MREDLIDDNAIEIGLRKHSDDKLTYKLIIANAINECRRVEGYRSAYENAVNALINLLFFDIKGYNLRSQIEDIIDALDIEKKKLYEVKEQTIERWLFYRKNFQEKFRLRLHRWYYETLFQKVLQVLASEGLLFDTEKLISVKSVGDETIVDEDVIDE